MSGVPVTIVDSGGLAVTAVDSGAPLMTAVDAGGLAVTLVDAGGMPFVVEGLVDPATWNPADKTANITLSNGNMTAAGSSGFHSVRSTTTKTSDVYFEATVNAVSGGKTTGVGIQSTGALPGFIGGDATGVCFFAGAAVYYNGAATGYGDGLGVGDVMSVCYSPSLKRIWFGDNGSYQVGDPVARTGGIDVSGITTPFFAAFCDAEAGSLTANFGATAFAHTPPTGFTPWNEAD